MNAKLRRHEARKAVAIQREADRKLSSKIEEAITGCSSKVNKTLSLLSVREIKTTICYVQKKADKPKPITARASERLVRVSKALI